MVVTTEVAMSYTVFLFGLPNCVSSSDLREWPDEDGLEYSRAVAVSFRHCAFIDAPTEEAMHAIIRRFDGATIEDPEQRDTRRLKAMPVRPRPARAGGR
jgi:hypothetical protein